MKKFLIHGSPVIISIRMRVLICCFITIFLITCNKDSNEVISPKAENFLNEVLDIMQSNSINRYKIEWPDFRAKVYSIVTGVQTIGETYPGISEALRLLGDNYSFAIKPDGSIISVSALRCSGQSFDTPTLGGNVGYNRVNSFNGSISGDDAISSARQIQHQIRIMDHPETLDG